MGGTVGSVRKEEGSWGHDRDRHEWRAVPKGGGERKGGRVGEEKRRREGRRGRRKEGGGGGRGGCAISGGKARASNTQHLRYF